MGMFPRFPSSGGFLGFRFCRLPPFTLSYAALFPYMEAVLRPFFVLIAMNIRKTMYKLQTALNMRGRRVKINQFQSWSDLQKRMVTKFVIIEDGDTILETYHTAEAVKALANLLGGD